MHTLCLNQLYFTHYNVISILNNFLSLPVSLSDKKVLLHLFWQKHVCPLWFQHFLFSGVLFSLGQREPSNETPQREYHEPSASCTKSKIDWRFWDLIFKALNKMGLWVTCRLNHFIYIPFSCQSAPHCSGLEADKI